MSGYRSPPNEGWKISLDSDSSKTTSNREGSGKQRPRRATDRAQTKPLQASTPTLQKSHPISSSYSLTVHSYGTYGTGGYPSPEKNGSLDASPNSARSNLHSPLSYYGSPSSHALGSPLTQEEFDERYRDAIQKEISYIDELDREHRWHMLQKVKAKNDEKIASMIEHTHTLMKKYGLSPSKEEDNSAGSVKGPKSRATAIEHFVDQAKSSNHRQILSAFFESTRTTNSTKGRREVRSLRRALESRAKIGSTNYGIKAEDAVFRNLVNARIFAESQGEGYLRTNPHEEESLSLDEFLSIAEHALGSTEEPSEPLDASTHSKDISPSSDRVNDKMAAGSADNVLAPNDIQSVSHSSHKTAAEGEASENMESQLKVSSRRKSLLLDVSSQHNDSSTAPEESLSGLIREGWLMKLGQNNKTWKRRWFQLVAYGDRGCSMLYFSEPPPSSSSFNGILKKMNENRKGAIHLTGPVAIDEVVDHESASIEQRKDHEQQFSISIATREIVLSCASAAERSEWIVDLKRSLSSADGSRLQACSPASMIRSTLAPASGKSGDPPESIYIRPLTKRHQRMTESMVAADFDESVLMNLPHSNARSEIPSPQRRAVVVLSGYLDKQASRNPNVLGWQRRYFVQAGKYLKYFNSRQDYEKHASGEYGTRRGPQGIIHLPSISITMHKLDPTGKTGGVFVIVLRGGSRKKILLRAPSELEAEVWIQSISSWKDRLFLVQKSKDVNYIGVTFDTGYKNPLIDEKEDNGTTNHGPDDDRNTDDTDYVATLASLWSLTQAERLHCLPLMLPNGDPVNSVLSKSVTPIGAYIVCLPKNSPSLWLGKENHEWTFVSKVDEQFIIAAQQSTVSLMRFLGLTKSYLSERCERGDAFHLLIFHLEENFGQTVYPTWDGIIALVEQESPTCAEKLRRHVPKLRNMPLKDLWSLGQEVESLAPEEIERVCSFDAYADSGDESLRHARAFLRHTLKCSQSFTGLGYHMTEAKKPYGLLGRGSEIIMMQQQAIRNVQRRQSVKLKMTLKQVYEEFDAESRFNNFNFAFTNLDAAETLGPLPETPKNQLGGSTDLERSSSLMDARPSGVFKIHHEQHSPEYKDGEEDIAIPELPDIQGELKKFTNRAFNNTWQKRYFSCDNFYLRYRFKSTKGSGYSKIIDLRQVKHIQISKKKSKMNEFSLCYENGEAPYRLRAKNVEEAQRWVAVLKTRIQQPPPPPPSTKSPEDSPNQFQDKREARSVDEETEQAVDITHEDMETTENSFSVTSIQPPPPEEPPPPGIQGPEIDAMETSGEEYDDKLVDVGGKVGTGALHAPLLQSQTVAKAPDSAMSIGDEGTHSNDVTSPNDIVNEGFHAYLKNTEAIQPVQKDLDVKVSEFDEDNVLTNAVALNDASGLAISSEGGVELCDPTVSSYERPPVPSIPVPRKSMLDTISDSMYEDDQTDGIVKETLKLPPSPPLLPPPNIEDDLLQPNEIFTPGSRVLAQYHPDEIFYQATVVGQALEGGQSYIVIFDGYEGEEVISHDVRHIDDLPSDAEIDIAARRHSVINDLQNVLHMRQLKSEEKSMTNTQKTFSGNRNIDELQNPVLERPTITAKRRPRRKRKVILATVKVI